jgi:hypothetical protein
MSHIKKESKYNYILNCYGSFVLPLLAIRLYANNFMKRHYLATLLSGILAGAISAQAQGTFQNLGFESPTFVPSGDTSGVQFSPAFPGWFGYAGGVRQTMAVSNDVYLDTSGIAIIDRGWANPFSGRFGLIEGNYTAVLMAGVAGGITNPANVTLSQTSLVPVTAQSLWFKAAEIFPPSFLQVSLGGERLSLVAKGSGANYTLYAADIRALAGQTAELDFTAIANPPSENYVFLDSIQFSDQAIPEPNVWALLAVGAAVFGLKLRRRLS